MHILNNLEFLSITKEIELCWISSHIGIKGNDQAGSCPLTKALRFWLKNRNKKLYPKQMAIKMEQRLTQQTPDYKSWNRRMERRIQKIPQGRDYPISSMYWTHRHHPLIATQTRTATMVCEMSYFIFSKTPIDRLHRPKRLFLHCKQYKRTIWTCPSRQNTSISKSSWSI